MDIEAVAPADPGRQVAMHPDERRGGRGQQPVGLNDAASLHVGHQRLPLGIGRRITASAGQSGDERCAFDALGIDTPRGRVVTDQFGVGLEGCQGFDFRALAADGRAGAAERGDHRNTDRESHQPPPNGDAGRGSAVVRVGFVVHPRRHYFVVRPMRRGGLVPHTGPRRWFPKVLPRLFFRAGRGEVRGRPGDGQGCFVWLICGRG